MGFSQVWRIRCTMVADGGSAVVKVKTEQTMQDLTSYNLGLNLPQYDPLSYGYCGPSTEYIDLESRRSSLHMSYPARLVLIYDLF